MTVNAEAAVMGSKYCTYRVGGPIDEAVFPQTLEEAVSYLEKAKNANKPLTVLGGCANTIIADRGIRGMTFFTKKLMFSKQLDDTRFEMGSGMPLSRVATYAQDRELTGAEFMIGVPGTLGGAITMNAGAMKQETQEIIETVILFNMQTGELEEWPHAKMAFEYRKSSVKPNETIVLAARLSLKKGNAEEIAKRMKESVDFRQSHHPKEPNGGSVFKNPSVERSAGRILDEMGAKGWQEGGAMISPRHANFIVNMGGATSTDILKLMLRMKKAIQSETHTDAHPENRFVGDASEEEIQLWKELTGHAPNC